MKKLLVCIMTISLLLTGCNMGKNSSITNEFGQSVSEINMFGKSLKKIANEIISEKQHACEITTYEYDMFINCDTYYENFRHPEDNPSYEEAFIPNIPENLERYYYSLYYAGWPKEETKKYTPYAINNSSFGLRCDFDTAPQFGYCCNIDGFQNDCIVKTYSFDKKSVHYAIENYRTIDENIYQLYFIKGNDFIFAKKEQNKDWEFFTKLDELDNFRKTKTFENFVSDVANGRY